MKALFVLLPGIAVSAILAGGDMSRFNPPVMRPLSLACLALILPVTIVKHRREGLSAIDRSFLLFVAVGTAAAWLLPQTFLPMAAGLSIVAMYSILSAMTALPALLNGNYFTEYFAHQSTPEAVWDTEIFKTINRHLTWFWIALFTGAALLAAIPLLYGIPIHSAAGIACRLLLPAGLLLGLGFPFSSRYPLYYQRRMGITPEPAESAAVIPPKEETMTHSYHVVAVNGSPHGVIGNTGRLLGMLAEQLALEGVSMEEITLTDKRIDYCIGCAVCLENARCWRGDDHGAIVDKLLAADGIILASPVYFNHVTAQLKTFIDRSLCFGHKPRTTWKPGLAVSVSAGKGETDTGRFLARTLHAYGAFPVGTLTALATKPGAFLGKEAIEARACDLAGDLARAIREKRRYPVTDDDLSYFLFMRDLVTRERDLMQDDYRYWQETGLAESFERYVQQGYAESDRDEGSRKEWVRELIREERERKKTAGPNTEEPRPENREAAGERSPHSVKSCRELIQMMPEGFRVEAAGNLAAVYQFAITGEEEFSAYLTIADGRCTYGEGAHKTPDIVINTPASVWLAISRREISGQAAFMSGKYKVKGDIGLIMKMKDLFG